MAASPSNIERVWTANEELWNTRIIREVLDPLEKEGGLGTPGAWQRIVTIAFGRTQKTFEAIQLLADPKRARRLWDDAFILTRTHYETFVTLEWIRLDQEARAQLLLDEFILEHAHSLDLLGEDGKGVRTEKREEILKERAEVLRRHSKGPGTLHLLPKLKERVREIATPLKEEHPNLQWEYDFYYRDVSGFAHPSGWGLVLSLSGDPDEVPMVEASVRNGYNAVFCNGGWFSRILKCWNSVFKRIPEDIVKDWEKRWAVKAGIA